MGQFGLFRRKKYEKEPGIFLNISQISLSLGIIAEFDNLLASANKIDEI